MMWRRFGVWAAAVGILAGAGCSSGDGIEPANGRVSVTLTVAPAHSGRFQRARLVVTQVILFPTTPNPSDSIGGAAGLGLLVRPRTVNLRQPGSVTADGVPLLAGTYRLETIQVTGYQLNVVDEESPIAVACSGGEVQIAQAPSTSPTSLTFPVPPLVEVAIGGNTSIEITVDAAGLVDALEPTVNCNALPDPTFPQPSPSLIAPFIAVD